MYNVNIRVSNSEINTQSERVLHERVYHPIKRKIGKADRRYWMVRQFSTKTDATDTAIVQA